LLALSYFFITILLSMAILLILLKWFHHMETYTVHLYTKLNTTFDKR